MAKLKSKKEKKRSKSSERDNSPKEKKNKSKKSSKKSKHHSKETDRDVNDEVTKQDLPDDKMNTQQSSNGEGNNKSEVHAKKIHIKLSVNIADKTTTNTGIPSVSKSSGFSWGAAFAAASTIRPNEDDLDEKFLKIAAASDAAGFKEGDGRKGVVDISKLAKEHDVSSKSLSDKKGTTATDSSGSKRKGKRKLSDSSSENGGNNHGGDEVKSEGDDDCASTNSDEEIPLEGRMETLSDGSMSLVLINRQSGKVYSSGERKPDGRRLAIGKLVRGKVELNPLALEHMKELEAGDSSSQVAQDAATSTPATSSPSFPYPTNADDHCETPLQSYNDILPILNELCKSLGGANKSKDSIRIYDPYYCNGSVVKHLASLGYTNVYNKKEDCYAIWESQDKKEHPQYDVFLTNPPYSDDHIEKLMTHVTSPSFGTKPWLLLMPNWVHKKDYYVNAISGNANNGKDKSKRGKENNRCNPFYIVPKKRYVYLPPPDFRDKKVSDVHKKSSPFVSMWYIWGGTEKRNDSLVEAFRKDSAGGDVGCDLARSRSALRDLRRNGGADSGKKEKGPKKSSKKNKKARTE